MRIRSITQAGSLTGKRVLVRIDANVPVNNGVVLDDTKLRASLPTIQYLRRHKAIVLLVTHLGRPDGKKRSALAVDPVMNRLSELLLVSISKIDTGNWELSEKKMSVIQQMIHGLRPGDVAMFENIRFAKEEEGNMGQFAKRLAAFAQVFVLDGFAVSHRADASVVGVGKYLPSYAGMLMEKEIRELSSLKKRSKKQFVTVLGGVKMETKIPVLKRAIKMSEHVLVGGGIFNTYLHAKGYGIGASLIDTEYGADVLRYIKSKNVVVPIDVIVGNRQGTCYRVVRIGDKPHEICKKQEAIFDIGPETIRFFSSYLTRAKTLVWNGAMGYIEQTPYDTGTKAIARVFAARSKGLAYGVVGGGETLQILNRINHMNDIDVVSTGGGAMLEFLSGKKLPGVALVTRYF